MLLDDWSLIPAAVEELLLRWESTRQYLVRYTLEDASCTGRPSPPATR